MIGSNVLLRTDVYLIVSLHLVSVLGNHQPSSKKIAGYKCTGSSEALSVDVYRVAPITALRTIHTALFVCTVVQNTYKVRFK